ncbi:MAG: VCBS repeat-containing protein, partial [Candidatus Peregrinibacteria bacterium]|nr:VCBS repeat-containing protein [Candidatus Peregrinibacteria bacterium]
EVLQNNSVLVNANRLYDIASLIQKEDVEDTDEYKDYGGCVFNNSITNTQTGSNPAKCAPEKADKSIFSVLGSKEVPEDALEVTYQNRCDKDQMIFKPINDDQFDRTAAGGTYLAITVGQDLEDVINKLYADFNGNLSSPSVGQKGSYVIKEMIDRSSPYTYSPLPEVEVEVSLSTQNLQLDSFDTYIEPTYETLSAIAHLNEPRLDPVTGQVNYPQIITPNTPADGIHFVSFRNNNQAQRFDYMNFFRVEGQNPGQITNNLIQQMNQKQLQLNQLTGTAGSTIRDFFTVNSDVREPIIWKSLSIDQKLAQILPKYLDQNSDLPTHANNPPISPQNQPSGYEVWHLVANGDAKGYVFGLNRAMQKQAPGTSVATSSQALNTTGESDQDGGADFDENNYVCGDPSGVEIWEWFDALQCWIDEEILPAHELFSVSNMCGTQDVLVEEEEELSDILGQILAVPTEIRVEMKRQSLVKGQEAAIKISALDQFGNPMLGFIDIPIHLELGDEELGSFRENDVYLFTGEKQITFTASPNKTGSTQLSVSMGDFETILNINVYEYISIDWIEKEVITDGRSEFAFDIRLRNPSGDLIQNINDTLLLAPAQPATGGFTRGGRVTLKNGQGNIEFRPTPGHPEILLMTKDGYLTGEHTIYPTTGNPTHLVIETPSYIPIGSKMTLKVMAQDDFGYPGANFNETVTVTLDPKSQQYAQLINPQVTLQGGIGEVEIQAGKESADINLAATHDELRTAEAQLPLLARVDSEEWKGYHPQNLFASFVGFPAGNFTQEDYFGGVHLFGGKTQAVYSFLSAPAPEATLSIAPNHLITLTSPSQTVYTELPPGQILFQVFDQATVRTQMTKRVNLNFDSVELLENERPKVGSAYLEMLDSDHRPVPYQDGFEIKNLQGKSLLSITTNSIRILDQNHQLVYRQEPEFGAPELILTDGLTESARLILHFQPKTLQTKDFESLHPQLYSSPLYSGKSVSDATGLIFHDVSAEVPEVTRAEFYGLEGDQKYLSLFASGTSAGEATKYNMPTGAILLGDPTIHLPTRSTTSLNYNTATGQQIFQDPENAQIASINHLNFNNDDDQDLVVLMEDGRVRLLEGGPTDPPYLDRGNIALLADEGVTMETFDFKNDDYEDILVATNKGRLAILNNDDEVITRTDQQLNIGKKMYKLIKADMDQDGFDDLVIHDSRGDILIFYYDSVNRRFPENGQLIGNYGFSVNINDNLAEGMQVRYAGLVEPQTAGPNVQPSNQSPQDYSGGGNISDADAQAFIDAKNAEAEAGRQGDTNASSAEVPKLPWPEDGELQTYFEPIENVRFLSPTKSIANKDRPGAGNVDLEETLTYTIELQSSVGIQDVVLADTLIDALSFNKDSVTCVQGGCESMEVKKNSTLLFFSGLNLSPTQPTIITYDALVSHTPASAMLAQKIDEPNQNLTNPASIIDPYTDVLISPPYNNSGRLIYHYSTGPRSYKVTVDNPPEPKAENAASPMQRVLDSMAAVQSGNFDGDNPPPPLELPPEAEGALMDATGGGGCTDSYESFVNCGNKALDDIADAIGNFACSGGGCWPMPWNYAFMVPPQTPFPIFSFPTTLPTPVGPVPFIWPGSFIGASNIPGPIMSQLRIYLSPTLTGGLGTAMCWGPYNPTPPPPPLFPIPYPPPIGNCIVKALPVQDMYGDLCETIEDGMDTIMDNIAAGVNWIESNVDEAASQLGGSAQIGGAAPNSSGLEISLAVNLGNSMRFEPPTKSFSNTHIPSFDSIGGAISDWFDRQTLEIQNKLLTFPTLSIYLPDFKTLFALDFSRTEKRFTQWKNQMSGNPYVNPSEDKGFPLEEMGAIQGGVNVANSLDGLYDVASTLPLVRLTEKPINFEIPWLSAGEIQSYIIELQNAVIYYEREYARVKDQWEAISCQDQPQAMTKEEAAENARNCQMRKLAESFGVSMDEFTNSVKENIEVLQSYLNYPKKLIKFKMQLADYIRSVACYIDVLAQMMGGWMATIRQQMISWAEMILTIAAIIDNIEQLFDLFVDFDDSCNICTNERYANFGWFGLLGLLLPDIPIIEFPKIPDIVLDMSDMEALIDIDLPILNLRTIPIPLPPIPYITLPDLPSIDAFLSLPPLPILPRLPELPDLPKLPPIPTIDLPTLPPPPKLPDLGESFDLIIPLIEKVLKIWCMMKKSFAPVPEMMLNDQISLLTNRPDYLIPLDVLKVQLPNFALFDIGFNEIRIETIVYLGLRINVIAKPLEEASADWNDWIRTVPEEMNAFYQEWIIETEAALQNQIDEVEQQLDAAAQSVETFVEEDIQGLLDKGPGELFDEADEYLREREEAWQDWADQANIEWTYDDYNIAVNNAFDTLSKAIFDKSLGDLRAGVRNAFENEGFGAAINILFPITYLLEKGDEANIDKEIQDILNEVRAEEEEIEITPPAPQASINRENMLNTPQGQEIIQIMTQISDIFEDVNERELVDYTVLKERFGVPDYNPTPQKTTVDKMEWMRNELIAHSDALMMEAESLQGVQDLHVIAGIPPRNPLPYELASEEFG